MDAITNGLVLVSNGVLRAAIGLLARRWILGLAIVTFTFAGIACILASGILLGGWWQSFFLEVGIGLLFTGIVDLAILGLIGTLQSGTRHDPAHEVEASESVSASLINMALLENKEVLIRIRPRLN